MHYWILYIYQVIGILIEINLIVTIELFPSYLLYMLSIQTEILGMRLERMSVSTCEMNVLAEHMYQQQQGTTGNCSEID